MASDYEKVNPKVKVNVTPMAESPSSEATIQAAIAGGKAPTISENIFRGFAAQLVDSKAIVPLDKMDGFSDIIKNRNMTNTIKSWKFSDGHQYVIPMYSNAMVFGWRLDILKQLGYNEPPKTYSEIIELGKKLKAKFPDKYLWVSEDLSKDTWWSRWFDFLELYDSATDKNKFVSGNKFVGDDKAGTDVLKFFSDLKKNNLVLAQKATDPFETGLGIMEPIGPWNFSTWAQKYPNLKYNENYTLSVNPVPDGTNTDKVKTFSDSKGLVIYSQSSKDKQKAALAFVKWVLSKPENDLEWLKITNLPPARDDLSTNSSFKSFFDSNPELKIYADSIPNAVPPMDNAKYNEIQVLIGQKALNPVIAGTEDADKAWSDLKSAINEELKK